MHSLQLGNDQVLVRVSREGRLNFQSGADSRWNGSCDLQHGCVELTEAAPVTGLFYYAFPCTFERLVVRLEGSSEPQLNRTVGEWPAALDDEELDLYPHLHFLEERKTGAPWRFERWYTLAGPYLIFDSEQYFERPRPKQHGRDWERPIVHLRQVMHVLAGPQNAASVGANLLSSSERTENRSSHEPVDPWEPNMPGAGLEPA